MLKNAVQKMKSTFGRYISLCAIFAVTGCELGYDISGSFEEADVSGRHLDGDARKALVWESDNKNPERYFRFHFRQFGNDIGGTFETFDMISYDLFKQTPTYMEQPLSYYYCARIDYGYVRDHSGYVFFTDKEQRQWNMVIDLSTDPPSGTLSRFNAVGDLTLDKESYYLKEDVEYKSKLKYERMPYPQIALEEMDKDTKRSLGCVYYYKTHRFEVILPAEITERLNSCVPSSEQCDNFKLAVVGMIPQPNIPESVDFHHQEIFSARLDDCDIVDGRRRIIQLRENPFKMMSLNRKSIFLATIILYKDIYKDSGRNNHWDEDEPIVAMLSDQVLVFYDNNPGTLYGSVLEDGQLVPGQEPVMREEQFDGNTGWFVYRYGSDLNQSNQETTPFKLIKTLRPNSADTLKLKAVGTASDDILNRQCYVNAKSDDTDMKQCDPFFPILVM